MKNTIVITDDSQMYCEILKGIVESLGSNPVLCKDGSEVIKYLSANNEDVAAVLLDIYIPQIAGECNPFLKNIRLIF